jgi:hypothetical protein
VTSIAVTEDTIGSLEDARRIAVASADARSTVLAAPSADAGADLARVAEALRAKTRYEVQTASAPAGAASAEQRIAQPWALVRSVGVGLDPEVVADIRAAGLGVVGRPANWRGVGPHGIVWTLRGLKEQGVHSVVFAGDEVLGYEGYIADDPEKPEQASTASALRDLDLVFGSVEFGKQKGDALLARKAADRTARVHTVTGAEMLNANVSGNVQRFALAARERNIRLLYVRLFVSEPDALAFNAKYVGRIKAALERGGLVPGPAHGYAPLSTPLPVRLLIGAGIAAGFVLLLDALTGLLGGGRAGVLVGAAAVLGAPLLLALTALPLSLGPKLAALTAACIFPSLGLLRADLLAPAPEGRPALATALGRFLSACAVTLTGAAMVVGLLSDRLYLLKVEGFMGIKLAHLVPVLLVALVVALDLRVRRGRGWAATLEAARTQVMGWMNDPVRVWQVVAAAVALGALAVLVMRSGNEGSAAVSGLELKIRALLDRLLYARPRFKEFLIGHPALVLALILAARGHRRWAMPLFVVGAVGQVSLLNTFCHLHTPLPVSLWRALLGIGIGVIIALACAGAAAAAAGRFYRSRRRRPAARAD